MYNYAFLYSYIHYCFIAKYIDLNSYDNVIEIGGGVGRQLEVIKKVHPHLNFYMIDMGCTLYACHQYLKSIFSDSIIDYRETADLKSISIDDSGKICFVGNWDLNKISPKGKTLGLGTAVFSLMRNETVSKYMSHLGNHCEAIYMMEPITDLTKKVYNMESSPSYETYTQLLSDSYYLAGVRCVHPLSQRKDFGKLK